MICLRSEVRLVLTAPRFTLTGIANLPRSFRLGTLLTLSTGVPFDITTGSDTNHDTVANDRPTELRGTSVEVLGSRSGISASRSCSDCPACSVAIVLQNMRRSTSTCFNALNQANFSNFVGVVSSPLFGEQARRNPGVPFSFL